MGICLRKALKRTQLKTGRRCAAKAKNGCRGRLASHLISRLDAVTPPTRLSGQNLWSGAWICPPATWATGGSGPQPYGAICNFGANPFGGGGRTGPTMEPATGFGLVWRIACRRTLPNRPPPRLLRSTRRRSSTSRCSVGPWPSSWASTRQKKTGFTASNHF